MIRTLTTFAQNREDIIVGAFFKDVKKGFYVDVGANHPINDSVTKLFYQQGWRGINIEPNESLHQLLVMDRPEDNNINKGVSDKKASMVFREYKNHGLSTFSREMQQEYEKISNPFTDEYKEYDVEVDTLADLFSTNGVKHIHFMKVDIEGYEYEALAGNAWDKFRPELICIESNHIVKDWRPLLARQHYTKVFFDGLNNYYLAEESKRRLADFSYPSALLLSGIVTQWPVLAEAQKQESQLKQERLRLQDAQDELKQYREPTAQRQSLKRHLREAAVAFDAFMNRRFGGTDAAPFVAFEQSETMTVQQLQKTMAEAYLTHHQDFSQRVILLFYRISRGLARRSLKAIIATKKAGA